MSYCDSCAKSEAELRALRAQLAASAQEVTLAIGDRDTMRRELAAAEAEVERLTSERDEARAIARQLHDEYGAHSIHPVIESWPTPPAEERSK